MWVAVEKSKVRARPQSPLLFSPAVPPIRAADGRPPDSAVGAWPRLNTTATHTSPTTLHTRPPQLHPDFPRCSLSAPPAVILHVLCTCNHRHATSFDSILHPRRSPAHSSRRPRLDLTNTSRLAFDASAGAMLPRPRRSRALALQYSHERRRQFRAGLRLPKK